MIKTHFAAKRKEKRNRGKDETEKINTAENDAKLAIKEKVISLASQVRNWRRRAVVVVVAVNFLKQRRHANEMCVREGGGVRTKQFKDTRKLTASQNL